MNFEHIGVQAYIPINDQNVFTFNVLFLLVAPGKHFEYHCVISYHISHLLYLQMSLSLFLSFPQLILYSYHHHTDQHVELSTHPSSWFEFTFVCSGKLTVKQRV